MNATFTWTVLGLPAYAQIDGETDVVFQVVWQCVAVQGQYTAAVNSSTYVPYIAGSPFTPYAQLTQEQVLGWVWANGVEKDKLEASLQKNIDDQINPPVVNLPLPWAPPTA